MNGFFSMYMSGLSSAKSGGGGIMILINNNFDKEVTKVIKDPNHIGKH